MTALEFNPGLQDDVNIGPPGRHTLPDDPGTPRLTPLEWARRRRVHKEARRDGSVRSRAMGRLHRLGSDWHLIEGDQLGLGKRDAFVAIGPGGVFAVTVKSQGRSRVRLSGDVIQINGERPPWIAESIILADKLSAAFSRTAGTQIPVSPVLALAGTGLISLWGVPRRCVVMPYRELDNLLGAYGERIGSRTVEKLASIARHPSTTIDLRSDESANAIDGYLKRSG
jgi:hypothetical protein